MRRNKEEYFVPNPEKLHPNTYPNRQSPYSTSADEKAARQTAAEAWLDGISALLPDPRRPAQG